MHRSAPRVERGRDRDCVLEVRAAGLVGEDIVQTGRGGSGQEARARRCVSESSPLGLTTVPTEVSVHIGGVTLVSSVPQ
jgi:hypothetical protein